MVRLPHNFLLIFSICQVKVQKSVILYSGSSVVNRENIGNHHHIHISLIRLLHLVWLIGREKAAERFCFMTTFFYVHETIFFLIYFLFNGSFCVMTMKCVFLLYNLFIFRGVVVVVDGG